MNKYIFFLAFFASSLLSSVKAQVYEKKTIEAGESISALSNYLFPSFSDAVVKLKNGGKLVSKMNFNLLLCQMQFIDPHGDTLIISKPADIDSIALGGQLFFYDEGYYQILTAADSVSLAVLRKVSYQPVKIGALGLPNHTGTGVESDTSLFVSSGEKKLSINEDVDVIKVTSYFLITLNGEMVKANKSGFLKLFSKNSERIKRFVKETKPSFNKETDLKKLFGFCVNLS